MNNRVKAIAIIFILFLVITPVVAINSYGSFTDLASSGNGAFTVKSTPNSTIWLFETGKNIPTWSYDIRGDVLTAAVSPDNNYFAVGSGSGKIWLFDQKGTVLWNKTFGNAGIKSIVFSEDSQYLDASSFMNQAFYISVAGNTATRPVSTPVSAIPSATPSVTQAQMPAEVDLTWIQSHPYNNLILISGIILGLCIAGVAWYTGSRRKYRQSGPRGSVRNIITLRNFTILSLLLIAAGGLLVLYAPANYGDLSQAFITFGIAGLLIAYFLYAVIIWGNDDKLLASLMLAIPLSVFFFSTSRIFSSLNVILYILIVIATYAVIGAILLFILDKIGAAFSHGGGRYFAPDLSYAFFGIIVVSLIMVSMGSTAILSENANSIWKSTTGFSDGTPVPVQTQDTITPVPTTYLPALTSVPTLRPTSIITTVPTTVNYETGLIPRSFGYNIRGKSGTISTTLFSGVDSYLISKNPPATCIRYNYDSSPCTTEEIRQYYLRIMDDPVQKKYLDNLVQSIKSATSDKDDQARIAISLVQQIPYDDATFNRLRSSAIASGGKTRYPYEVLYDNTGVCGEKSRLLAYLLRELGFGVVLFEYSSENHMAVGIKSPAPYAYKNSGYAFIESTTPSITTDDQGDYVGVGKLTSTPAILLVSEGRSFDSISEEYRDALLYNSLLDRGQVLDEYSYYQWLALVQKYGMMTGTSSSQGQISQSYSGTCNINLGRYCSAGLNCCERDNLCYLPCSRGTWVPSECVCAG